MAGRNVRVYPLGYTNSLERGIEYDVIRPTSYDGDLGDIDNCTFYANPRNFRYVGEYVGETRDGRGAVTWEFNMYQGGTNYITWQEDDQDEAPPCFREHEDEHANRGRHGRRRRHRGGSRRSSLHKKSRKQKTRRN